MKALSEELKLLSNNIMKKGFLVYLFILTMILSLDLFTKALVTGNMDLYQSIPVIGDFLKLTYVRNSGAAFSMLAGFDSPLRLMLFITVKSVAAIVVTFLALREPNKNYWFISALALIGAGALGNLYDRITVGTVVDFIDFSYRSFHFPVFNVADSAVCTGVAILIIDSFFEQYKNKSSVPE